MTHEHENTNSPAVADIRELVALSSRILGHTDQGDLVWGHASARDPHGRGVWMKASGWGLEEITPERVHLVSPSGEVLQGTGGRHSEYPIHTEIMAARADVGGVVHTHSPYAVALAAAGQPLLPVSHAATYFVPPEVPRFTDTADLILTSDLGKRVAASLGSASAVFLVNHGIVTAGPTLQVATVAAVLLERAAHQQWITHGFRSWPTWSDAPEALSKRDHIYHPQALDQVWNYLVRRLERLSHPGEPPAASRSCRRDSSQLKPTASEVAMARSSWERPDRGEPAAIRCPKDSRCSIAGRCRCTPGRSIRPNGMGGSPRSDGLPRPGRSRSSSVPGRGASHGLRWAGSAAPRRHPGSARPGHRVHIISDETCGEMAPAISSAGPRRRCRRGRRRRSTSCRRTRLGSCGRSGPGRRSGQRW